MSIPTRSPWSSPAQNTAAGNAELRGIGYGHFGKSAKKSKWPYRYIPEWSSTYAKTVCTISGEVFRIYAVRLAGFIGVFQIPSLFVTDSVDSLRTVELCLWSAIVMFSIVTILRHQNLVERLSRAQILVKIYEIGSWRISKKRGLSELEIVEKEYEAKVAKIFDDLENVLATSESEDVVRASIQELSTARRLNPIIHLTLFEIEVSLNKALEARILQDADDAARAKSDDEARILQDADDEARAKSAAKAERDNWNRVHREMIAIIDAKFAEVGHIVASEFDKKIRRNAYGQIVLNNSDEASSEFLNTLTVSFVDRPVIKSMIHLLHLHIAKKVDKYNETKVPIAADMTPIGFEHHVASELRRYGWEAEVTKASGDQGIDVIASRGRFKVGIQCKYYKGSVPNKAVQEAYTGKSHYNLHGAAVVTTGTFTKSALEVANSTGVVALNHHLLSELHLRFGLN